MYRIRYKKAIFGLVFLAFLSSTLVLGVQDAIIDVRMDEFKDDKVLLPQYRSGVTYQIMIRNPDPDTIYSYMVDNWDYATELLEAFHRHKGTLLSGDEAVIVVAMKDGTFIAAGLNLETQVLYPGYAPVANQLRITEEFLASAVIYMDLNSAEESYYYVLEYYDAEWYIIARNIRMPLWAVALVGSAAMGSLGLFARSRTGGKK